MANIIVNFLFYSIPFYSILFYSILFYSILFYSILFYSILFYSILFYSNIKQDATLHSLFYLETALHISGGTTTQHQERKQLYLQHLVFVTPLLLSAAIAEELELV